MKKALLSSIVFLLFVTSLPIVAGAASNTTVALYVNGAKLETAPAPRMIRQHAYLTLETLASITGATLLRDETGGRATLKSDGWSVVFRKGERYATVTTNGAAAVDVGLPSEPVAETEDWYVPVKPVGGAIGVKYIWDPLSGSLFVYKRGESVKPDEFLEQSKEDNSRLFVPIKTRSVEDSVAVVGIEANAVTIALRTAEQPRVLYLSDRDPVRVVLDFPASAFGFADADEMAAFKGEVPVNEGIVSRVRYAQFDSSTVRFVIELTTQSRFQVAAEDQGKRTAIRFEEPKGKPVIVIDAGHGGKDPGATKTASGKFEKDFNLIVARKVFDLMSKDPDLQPHMVRNDDRFIELEDRAAFANDLQAALFISIHGNSFDGSMSGTETYYLGTENRAFAAAMHKQVQRATGFPDRGLREARFRVLRQTSMPAVLLELGYMTDKEEEREMWTEAFQDRVAEAIAAGAREYLGLQ